jgi:hypothetical protein
MKIADTAADLADRSAHFEFGENWRDYARSIDQSRIDQSIAGLKKLFPDGLSGKSVIDIGCGARLPQSVREFPSRTFPLVLPSHKGEVNEDSRHRSGTGATMRDRSINRGSTSPSPGSRSCFPMD